MNALDIAVLIPCYNEAPTISDVVKRFRATLPNAKIYVYDNNSTDNTVELAKAAGAITRFEKRQGKGQVVRRMFSDIDADVYIMADGDGTYMPEDAPKLVEAMLEENVDMVIGTRAGITDDAGRAGHAFGNALFNKIYGTLFYKDFSDILSGYRAFTRRYVKSFPAISTGFEIETEMSVHAGQLRLPTHEIELDYGRRLEGSESKLSTFADGTKILWMFVRLMKETKPLQFFGMIAAVFFAVGCVFIVVPVFEFLTTGLVTRMPTWVGAIGLLVLGTIFFVAGLILHSVAAGRAELKRMTYLSIEMLDASKADMKRLAASKLKEMPRLVDAKVKVH